MGAKTNQVRASGHTRTISIPGCVKFNLSTNACRGFCMSYSIPAVEDLGPSSASSSAPLSSSSSSPAERANALLEAGEASSDRRKAAQSAVWLEDKILREQLAAKSHFGPHEVAGAKVVPVGAGEREAGGRVVYPEQQQQLALGWGLPSTVSPGGGQTGERDVVSVSQCCNMMDTEDVSGPVGERRHPRATAPLTSPSLFPPLLAYFQVVVNLRCGSNEIRRLVFKSAKTCQCHFCKHV